MENTNKEEAATPPLSVPSADSQPTGEGGRIPRRSEGGGDAGGVSGSRVSTPDSSTGLSLPVINGDENEVSVPSLAAYRGTAVDIPPTATTTTNPLGGNTAVDGQTSPETDSVGQKRAESSEGAEAGSGEQGLRDLNSMARARIPDIPVVFATELKGGHEDKGGKPPPGGRFGRPHNAVTEETKAEAKRQFWAGVKPARANSLMALPTGGGPPGLSMVTIRAAMKLKKKANVIQAKSVLNKYILNPRSLRMQYWKNWMLVNIMFTVLVTPWRISFQVPARAFGLVLAGIVNISFIADTILHFFTAVQTESALLTDRKEIARRYLKSWFFLDLVTCCPYTTLLRNLIPPSLRAMAPLRGLRLLKLLKVVKVYTMHYEVSQDKPRSSLLLAAFVLHVCHAS